MMFKDLKADFSIHVFNSVISLCKKGAILEDRNEFGLSAPLAV